MGCEYLALKAEGGTFTCGAKDEIQDGGLPREESSKSGLKHGREVC
jgi:hypothetical protein